MPPGSALTPEFIETVKRIYRSTCFLSTLKRDELIHQGRQEQVESMIRVNRKAEAEVLSAD